MSTDYTPTTEQVRSHYVFDQGDVWRRERGEAFDHWLAAHDREVAAKALEDAAGDFEAYVESGAPVGAGTTPEKWLRARAASLRGEGEEAQ